MRKGSTRSTYAMRPTGGDMDGISQKPSKKLKQWSTVGETYQSNSTKRVKLPKKFFNGLGGVNHSSVPRKLRSAMKKRHKEFVALSIGSEMPSKDRNKKLKFDRDDRQHSTISESITEQTEDEKDAMEALLAMAGNDSTDEINLKTKILDPEASSLQEKCDVKTSSEAAIESKPENLVQKHMQIQDLNEGKNRLDVKKASEDFTDGKKRCALHVYICGIIKDRQVTEGKIVNSHEEPKQRDYAEAKANTNRFDAASEQVVALPYFGSPLYDPSQWSRPVFPKHEMWMDPFVPGARYQNGGREMMPAHSGSYIGPSGPKYAQPSLLDVIGSKDARVVAPQLQYKMRFGSHSSRYEENRGSFFVDNSPILKLTL